MKYALSVLLLLNTSHPAHAGGLADEREQAAAACRILDTWHAELLTDPTEDGPGGDWALWLEPVLKRR